MQHERVNPRPVQPTSARPGPDFRGGFGLFVMVLALGACSEMRDGVGSATIRDVIGGTVQLFTERDGGGRRAGSGVILSTGFADKDRALILTTAHLFEPVVDQTIYVVPPRGADKVPATIAFLDTYRDLALLDAPAIEGTAVDIAAGARLTDEIWIVAYPWGRERTIVKGIVGQIDTNGTDNGEIAIRGPVTLVDATVSYGMSGGGVYHPRTGELVGLVRGYRTAHLSIGSDSTSLQIPVAGETTVISTHELACFLSSLDLDKPLIADQDADWVGLDCPHGEEADAAQARKD